MISAVSVISVLAITSISSLGIFGLKNSTLSYSPNNVYVQKIDENNAHIHSESLKTSRGDFLFCKSKSSDGAFEYDICSLDSAKRLYGFSSPLDIVIEDGVSSNSQLSAAIAMAAQGAGGLATVAAIGSAASAAPAVASTASAIGTVAACGATSAATIGSFSAGAQVAGALILAATGPVAIIAGAGALIGAG